MSRTFGAQLPLHARRSPNATRFPESLQFQDERWHRYELTGIGREPAALDAVRD
jgi:hypothetical protein